MQRRAEVWIEPSAVALDPDNANKMSDREFQSLIDAIHETGGLSENIVVVDMREDPAWDKPEPYLCVSGEHRTRAAIEAGLPEIPARVFHHNEWDEDMRAIQGVRHNVIKGNLDALKFAKLVQKLSSKYGRDRVRELMKFSDKTKFDRLVDGVTKTLPKEVKDQVDKAKDEGRIETIDQLSRILNEAFKAYGDTLPHHFMVFDFGGKKHIWIRMQTDTRKAMDALQTRLSTERKGMSDFFNAIIQHEVVDDIIADLPTVSRPDRGSVFKEES